MITLLAVILLCRPEDRPYDAMFLEVQEHWVIDSMPVGYAERKMGAVFGPDNAKLIYRLGHDRYKERQLAYEILEGRGDVFRLAVWGTRCRDKQIVMLCDKLLFRKYYKCFSCEGSGFIGGYGGLGCDRCNTTGDVRKGLYNCYVQ